MTVARFLVVSLNTGKVFEYDHESEVIHFQSRGHYSVIDTHTGKYWSNQGGGKQDYISGHPKTDRLKELAWHINEYFPAATAKQWIKNLNL